MMPERLQNSPFSDILFRMESIIANKRGDITQESCDAIVNAANSSLLGGGGVDGAIHRAGGPAILQACQQIREEQYPDGLPTGQAVITTGGDLPSRYVIHTVGPRWKGGNHNEEILLRDAYYNSLTIARKHKLKTIAFPSISTGIYGFPIEKATPIALKTVSDFIQEYPCFEQVLFVLFSDHDLEVYSSCLLG